MGLYTEQVHGISRNAHQQWASNLSLNSTWQQHAPHEDMTMTRWSMILLQIGQETYAEDTNFFSQNHKNLKFIRSFSQYEVK